MKLLAFTSLFVALLTGCSETKTSQTEQSSVTTMLSLSAPNSENDNSLPTIRSSDLEVIEGDNINPVVALRLSLNKSSHLPIGVSYRTVADSARSPEHFEMIRGRLVFSPGEIHKHVEIQVYSDKIANGDREFHLQLSSASNAEIAGDGKYKIEIKDDLSDAPAVMGVAVSANLDDSTFQKIEAGDGASQLKNVALSGVRYIRVRFSSDVIVKQNDLNIINSVKGKVYNTTQDFYYDSETHSATWEVSPLVNADRLKLVLNSSHIVDNYTGVNLDGTWVNPDNYDDLHNGSNFPSGGRGPGNNFEFRLNVLACDMDQNDMVNQADITNLWELLSNATYESSLDINQDGVLDELDIKTCEGHIGDRLVPDSL